MLRADGHSKSRLPQYALILAVGNTDIRMCQRLADLFGGKVIAKGSLRNRTKQMWEYRVFSRNAARVIGMIRPYLVVKGEQADVAMAFAETIRRTGGHTEEVRAARADMKARLKLLKREEIA